MVDPESWTQTNRGFHAVFPTLSCAVAKQLFYVSEDESFPAYIDDSDQLVVLNVKVYDIPNVCVLGIWISLIDPRADGKHGFCRVTDTTTRRFDGDVRKLLNSSPDKFLKDLWLATTSRTLQVPSEYFSKRLGGFLISTPEGADDVVFQTLFALW